MKAAEATPPIDPLTLFDDVYHRLPPALEAERGEFARLIEEGVLKP